MAKPNIVFITCHDLGRHLGCLGAGVESPNIDRLSAEGTCFSSAFATSPLCSPSRAAIHTGMYPHNVGVNGLSHAPFGWEIKQPEAHLAHLLAAEGYAQRVLVGFQHLTANSQSLGYSDARFRLGSAESISCEASEVIEKMDTSDPFYLEVGFYETHRPFDWGGVGPGDYPGENPFPHLPDGEAVRKEAAALAGAVKALDAGVGRILDTLETCGLHENTWVIFVTDHGLPFPRAKGTLYDPGLEAALLMRWPAGGIPGGARAEGLVSLVDLVPTIAEALGLETGEDLDGMSLWNWIRSGARASSPRKNVFGQKTFHTGYEPMRCIRTDTHKLILNFETGPAFDIPTDIIGTPTTATILDELVGIRPPVELYDLLEDPLERKNLADVSELSGERDRLLGLLGEWMRETEDPLLEGPVDSPTIRRLLDRIRR